MAEDKMLMLSSVRASDYESRRGEFTHFSTEEPPGDLREQPPCTFLGPRDYHRYRAPTGGSPGAMRERGRCTYSRSRHRRSPGPAKERPDDLRWQPKIIFLNSRGRRSTAPLGTRKGAGKRLSSGLRNVLKRCQGRSSRRSSLTGADERLPPGLDNMF